MARGRLRRRLDRWVEPDAQKFFVVLLALIALGVACWLPLRATFAPAPALTTLAPYDLTPAGQRVTRFEFSAARDRALIVAAVAGADDPDRRGRAELYLWEPAARRPRSLGRFDGVGAPDLAWVADGALGRTTDGGFYLFTDGGVLLIAADSAVTPYPHGNRYGQPQLSADELLALRRAYEAHPERTVAQIEYRGRPSWPSTPYRLYEFDSRRAALQLGPGLIVPANPAVGLNAPPNPAFAGESAVTTAWSAVPYSSPSERLRVTATVYGCVPFFWCLKQPTYTAQVDGRRYAFGYPPTPFVPQSGYLTAADGTLFWLRDAHLYALR